MNICKTYPNKICQLFRDVIYQCRKCQLLPTMEHDWKIARRQHCHKHSSCQRHRKLRTGLAMIRNNLINILKAPHYLKFPLNQQKCCTQNLQQQTNNKSTGNKNTYLKKHCSWFLTPNSVQTSSPGVFC